MMTQKERLAQFEALLSDNKQDLPAGQVREQIYQLALGGLPDEPKYIRSQAYQILLNLAPTVDLAAQYKAFVQELGGRLSSLDTPPCAPGAKLGKEDHLLREIQRDAERTFGTLAWFGYEPEYDNSIGTSSTGEDAFWARIRMLDEADKQSSDKLADKGAPTLNLVSPENQDEPVTLPISPITQNLEGQNRPYCRRQVLLRPLFVYATLNPGLGYVQGMNSIAAVLFFIYSTSNTPWDAEVLTFFSLGHIIGQIRDLFVSSLDGQITAAPTQPLFSPGHSRTSSIVAPTGLGPTLTRFSSLINWLDPMLSSSLERKEIVPELYVFRWITTLFANEFPLPDVVRVWDRLISLFPADGQALEALSPILGHLLDLSLALVLSQRQVIISPYSNFQKILTTLQNPALEGEEIDALLHKAWDIRLRRLGKNKRSSTDASTSGNWFAATQKWSAAAAQSDTTTALKQRFWSASSHLRSLSLSNDMFTEARLERERTHLQNQSVDWPSSRLSMDPIAEIEGKKLPPPPDMMDDREQRMKDVPPTPTDGENVTAKFVRAGTTIKQSMHRIADSDAAASVAKATTNFSLQATLLKNHLTENSPDIGRIKDNVATVSGRFMASTGSEASGNPRRPGSPVEEPFVPPSSSWHNPSVAPSRAPLYSNDLPFTPPKDSSPVSEDYSHQHRQSGAPKPLFLSGSARRATNSSQDIDSSTSSGRVSPVSLTASTTSRPKFFTDAPIAPLGIARTPSPGGRIYTTSGNSGFFTPVTRANNALGSGFELAYSEDVPIRPVDTSTHLRRQHFAEDFGSDTRRGRPSSLVHDEDFVNPQVSDEEGLPTQTFNAEAPKLSPRSSISAKNIERVSLHDGPVTSIAVSQETSPQRRSSGIIEGAKIRPTSMHEQDFGLGASGIRTSKVIRRAPGVGRRRKGRSETNDHDAGESISSMGEVERSLSHQKRRSVSSFLKGETEEVKPLTKKSAGLTPTTSSSGDEWEEARDFIHFVE